jgi:hypothetical protein
MVARPGQYNVRHFRKENQKWGAYSLSAEPLLPEVHEERVLARPANVAAGQQGAAARAWTVCAPTEPWQAPAAPRRWRSTTSSQRAPLPAGAL